MQVPEAIKETVVPETVHTVAGDGAMVTLKPEVELALSAAWAPTDCGVAMAANVMLWASLFTMKLCETGAAAEYAAFPACFAVIVQVPPATNEAVEPDSVQIEEGEAVYVMANPEVAVAVKGRLPPAIWLGIDPNEIDCAILFTTMLWLTALAAA